MTDSRYDFLVFSDDWGRHPSSCQHLVRRLATRHRILWVNTLGLRAAKADGFTAGRAVEKFRQWARPLRQAGENFFVYSPAMLPAAGGMTGRLNSHLTVQRLRRVLGRCGMRRPVMLASVPTAADYVDSLDLAGLIYYITDDYRHWPAANADAIAAQDRLLTERADLLLPCSEALAEGRQTAGAVELLPHAVDLAHFSAARSRTGPEPDDLAGIPHPRLCFFGLLYQKVDLELLRRLAAGNADMQLVLIGPVKADVSALAALPNVHLLGPKPYEQLPRYLAHTDVLLLPYVLDEQIRRSAPLKIRECLAAGKPIVAVDVPDLRRYDGLIRLAGDREQFFAACRAACGDGDAPADRMRAAVAGDTWQARAEQIERALGRVIGRRFVSTTSADVKTELCSDGAAWDRYVSGHAAGAMWHRWGWSEVMRSAYGLQCPFLLARRGRQVVGVLPLALQASRAFGRHLVSLPWLDHAGVLADDVAASEALATRALALASQWRADLTLRELTGRPGAATRTDKVAMTLELPAAPERLWDGLKAKVRNQIRKARKSGLSTRWGGPESVGRFYAVYSANMRDLGSPPHSLAFFRSVLTQFAGVARLLLVRDDNTTVAAALVLADPAGWQVPWASSLREHNRLCPSHLMYWTILEAACGQAPRFCFGRSSVDSGTYKFKAQWGTSAVQLHWHTLLATAAVGDGQPGRSVQMVQRLWRRMPASLARTLGPHVIRCVG